MTKRILALLLTLALVLPAVSCDILLADPNAPVTPSDSQSESNSNTPDTERVPSKGPEVHTQPETPPDSEPPVEWPDEPQDSEQIDPPVDPEPETEYIPKEFKVTFMLEGYDHEYGIQFVKEGNTVGKPQVSIDPAIGSFDGIWYTDPHFKQVFDFGTYIAGDITLFGRFVPNPAAPALLITPEQLAEQASEVGGYAQSIASADVMTNGSNSFVRLTASNIDPYFMAAQNCGKMPDYLVIRYRTNSESGGEMFIGSGNGPHGGGDHAFIDWTGDNEWHLAIIHLPSCGASTIKNGVIDYLRMDFFRYFIEGDYIDFAYIGFFNSAEYAEAYDLEHYPPYVEKEAAGMKNHSIDTFFVNGKMYFEQDGAAGDKLTAQNNTVLFTTAETHDSMMLRGWIGFDQPFVNFGYYVDDYEMIYNADFTRPTENAVKMAGGEHASRFEITVPLEGLSAGDHTVGFIVKLEDGTVVRLREELTVVIENTKWDENRDIVVHQSFDELFYEPGRVGIFTPGQSSRWDKVATITDFSVDTLYYWGWIAYNGEFGQFGYQINGGTPIYNETFATATEQGVIVASKGTGADSGQRMNIAISLAGLEGTNTVTVLYRNAAGKVVVLNEFTVILPNEYIVGLNKETGGHIQNGDQAVYDQGSSFGYIGTKVANPGKLSGTIEIDGVMDMAYMTSATFLTLPHQMGTDNGNTAFAWVTYDDAYIYTFVEVTDWTLDASSGFVWQKDSVSFITDFNYNRDVEEYTGKGMGYATIAIDGITAFYHETANGVPYAVVVDEENNKYYVEIAMPILDSFNGEYLGFEITICDAANGGQIGGSSWNLSGVLHAWHYTHVCGTLNLHNVKA